MEDLKRFAHRVKSLRIMKHMTKEEVCQDETELTVRQLTRIESGKSKPTLTKINFLADRLGMKIYELMPDYQDLPRDYLDIKYHLLRDVTYSDDKKIEEKEKQFHRIYDIYYSNLPEEEQLIIDTMRTIYDVNTSGVVEIGNNLLRDYLEPLERKPIYTVNDLLLIQLLVITMLHEYKRKAFPNTRVFQQIVDRLLVQGDELRVYQLFVLRDTLFVAVGLCFYLEQDQFIRRLLDKLREIMDITQDYQKKALVDMFEWKYQLKIENNAKKAYHFYRKALLFATLMEDSGLLEHLKEEWLQDKQ